MPLVEQKLLTILGHLRSPPVSSGVRVTRSLVLCVYFVDRCLLIWWGGGAGRSSFRKKTQFLEYFVQTFKAKQCSGSPLFGNYDFTSVVFSENEGTDLQGI